MCVGSAYMCDPHTCLVSSESEEGDRSPGNGVTGDWEPPCGWWGLNPGPSQKPCNTANILSLLALVGALTDVGFCVLT